MLKVYKGGLPFDETLGKNIKDLDTRIRKDKAALIIIDGAVGEGKSTLAVHIANYVNSLHNLKPISLKPKYHPQYAMGGENFLDQFPKCFDDKLPSIIYDEAGDFNKRGSLTRFNATINRVFETFRAFKILVILCLPSFSILDNELLLKGIPQLLIHTRDRNDKWGNYQAYSLYRMYYVKEKMKKLIVKPFAYNITKENLHGHFKNLDETYRKQLDHLSTSGKKNILQKSQINVQGLMDYKTMASKLGLSHFTLRAKVGELKIKPAKVINRVRYFDDNAFNRIADN